jgi:hypothetical protein
MYNNPIRRTNLLALAGSLTLPCLGCDVVMGLTSSEFQAQFEPDENPESSNPAPVLSGDYCTEESLPNPCDELPRSTFRSIRELDCGIGLDEDGNVTSCRAPWVIIFHEENHTFTWLFSDVDVSGTYDCDDTGITADARGIGPIEAQYFPNSCVLIWDGIEYTPRPEEVQPE